VSKSYRIPYYTNTAFDEAEERERAVELTRLRLERDILVLSSDQGVQELQIKIDGLAAKMINVRDFLNMGPNSADQEPCDAARDGQGTLAGGQGTLSGGQGTPKISNYTNKAIKTLGKLVDCLKLLKAAKASEASKNQQSCEAILSRLNFKKLFYKTILKKMKEADILDCGEAAGLLGRIEALDTTIKTLSDEFLRRYLFLIEPAIRTYRNEQQDDMFQEGSVALLLALERYDPTQGRFSNYASLCIEQSIKKGHVKANETIHIPNNIRLAQNRLQKTIKTLTDSGNIFSESEVAQKAGTDVATLRGLAATMALKAPLSLDARQCDSDGVGSSLGDTIKDESPSQETLCIERETAAEFRSYMEIFKKQSRSNELTAKVMKYRFMELTLREIGDRLNLSPQRVHQLHAAGMRHFRKHFRGMDQ
jgi:RNA polymerase sigma factor (sigma-70 family)